MTKYIVDVKEIWTRSYEVEANSPEEARELANQAIEAGEEELCLDYSHTLEGDLWTVAEMSKDGKEVIDFH